MKKNIRNDNYLVYLHNLNKSNNLVIKFSNNTSHVKRYLSRQVLNSWFQSEIIFC